MPTKLSNCRILSKVKPAREILFRGKRLDNGEWVEGFLYITNTGEHEIGNYHAETNIERRTFEVNPSTVGQYTGLKDKSGKKIFEGDILEDFVGDVYEVFYNTEHCAYMAHCRMARRPEKKGYYRLGDCCSLTIEVIGNIHDNQELLEEEQ